MPTGAPTPGARGDLVVWDNRAVLHTASPCDSTRHRRLLVRATVR
ncbi:TauD/TfdA family dioxygenase [Kitasatospora sp. NPDC058263]